MTTDLDEANGLIHAVGYGILAWVVVLSPLWGPMLISWIGGVW